MIQHIILHHPKYLLPGINDTGEKIPKSLALKIMLPPEEEKAMGIPAHRMMLPLLEGVELDLEWVAKLRDDNGKGKKRAVEMDDSASNTSNK